MSPTGCSSSASHAVTVGSAYYHAWPSDATLSWDRLPMTVAFMALFATLIGDRMSARDGPLLLIPLIAFGVTSILYWPASCVRAP